MSTETAKALTVNANINGNQANIGTLLFLNCGYACCPGARVSDTDQ